MYLELCQIFKMKSFAKRMQATRVFLVCTFFGMHMTWYIFVKNTKKRAPTPLHGNILEFFLLDTFKTTFLMENLIQRWMQSGRFFPEKEHYFQFLKRAGEASPQAWLYMH